MPRRKYGRMIKPLPLQVKPEKCRFCKAGRPCPVHRKDGEVTSSKP